MKKLLSSLILSILLIALGASTVSASSDYKCGEWWDVTKEYVDELTSICELGLFQGYSEYNFGFGETLTRSEMATVANRLIMGTAEYDAIENFDDFGSDTWFLDLEDNFYDIPNTNFDENFWMIKAMYYAVHKYEIMSGDDNNGYLPTSFRPTDDVNIVESIKVLYEAALFADLISDDVSDPYVSYSGNPWWEEVMTLLDDESIIVHLDTDYQSFWLSGGVTKSFVDFGSSITREDAALLLYNMYNFGLIDEDALRSHMAN